MISPILPIILTRRLESKNLWNFHPTILAKEKRYLNTIQQIWKFRNFTLTKNIFNQLAHDFNQLLDELASSGADSVNGTFFSFKILSSPCAPPRARRPAKGALKIAVTWISQELHALNYMNKAYPKQKRGNNSQSFSRNYIYIYIYI